MDAEEHRHTLNMSWCPSVEGMVVDDYRLKCAIHFGYALLDVASQSCVVLNLSPSSAAHVAAVVLWVDRRVVLPEGAHDVVVNAPFEMDSSGMGTWFGLLDVQVSPSSRSAA